MLLMGVDLCKINKQEKISKFENKNRQENNKLIEQKLSTIFFYTFSTFLYKQNRLINKLVSNV